MFLTENVDYKYNNQYYDEATDEPSYMYEAILEANEAYHELCMKMIKCEHTCIVNEDAEMLAEAEESFKEKSINVIKTLWEKFKAFCSKMYDTMLQLMTKAAKILAFAKAENGKGKKVQVTASMMDYVTFAQSADKILADMITNSSIPNSSSFGNTTGNAVVNNEKNSKEVDAGDSFNYAVQYIDDFKPAMAKVKALRSANLKSDKDPEVTKAAIALCTKTMSRLRAGLIQALKIIYACSAGAKAVNTVKSKIPSKKA